MSDPSFKIWPAYYSAVLRGDKTAEIRTDCKGLTPGALFRLREWCPSSRMFTGSEIHCRARYITPIPEIIGNGFLICFDLAEPSVDGVSAARRPCLDCLVLKRSGTCPYDDAFSVCSPFYEWERLNKRVAT